MARTGIRRLTFHHLPGHRLCPSSSPLLSTGHNEPAASNLSLTATAQIQRSKQSLWSALQDRAGIEEKSRQNIPSRCRPTTSRPKTSPRPSQTLSTNKVRGSCNPDRLGSVSGHVCAWLLRNCDTLVWFNRGRLHQPFWVDGFVWEWAVAKMMRPADLGPSVLAVHKSAAELFSGCLFEPGRHHL